MHFDDRLATVLRHRATGERAARTQYRQLLDLLGQRARGGDRSLEAAAFLRLDALGELITRRDRARIVEESASRVRNPGLVEWFGEADPDIAAAGLGAARLETEEWTTIIPELPIRARGFLRHRRDLPPDAVDLLDRLGVSDRGLPQPSIVDEEPLDLDTEAEFSGEPTEEPAGEPEKDEGIGALVRRIEAYTRARDERTRGKGNVAESAPRLPLGEAAGETRSAPVTSFVFGTDTQGRIDWADPEIAPMIVGTDLILRSRSQQGTQGQALASKFYSRLPIRETPLSLEGAEKIAGEWMVDAVPQFTRSNGRFYGYAGRFRRPAGLAAKDRASQEADRLRQLLHELRTPVNAIQGFAEVIQQQLFGATPHEYRALAANIASDSAHMLAGFDEIDRLAKLEAGALDLETGESDFAAILRYQTKQLQTVLSPRVACFRSDLADKEVLIRLASQESEMLAWRLLATIASATGAGEELDLDLNVNEEEAILACDLPAALAKADDIFSAETRPAGGALSAGVFGAGFSLRLARAEARKAGGQLARVGDRIILTLPLLTAQEAVPSPEQSSGRAAG